MSSRTDFSHHPIQFPAPVNLRVEMLKSVVYGAGAIGSVLGARLHQAERDVVLVARPNHVNAINEKGLSVSGIEEYVVKVPASSDPSVVKNADLVFLTVKTQDTKTAVEELYPYLQDSASVVSLQNGVRNPEIIASIVGEDMVVPGVVRFMASYLKPGEVEYTWKGNCIIGESSGVVTDRIKRISEYVSPAVETRTSTNIEGEMWTKLILNLINIPLALTDMTFPFGFRDRHLRLITEAAWSEGYNVEGRRNQGRLPGPRHVDWPSQRRCQAQGVAEPTLS